MACRTCLANDRRITPLKQNFAILGELEAAVLLIRAEQEN